MNDIQIRKILEKAQTLKNHLNDELARKVLEVDVSAISAKQETLLKRTIRSLEQYVNKERSLTYIGFLGHYSSGKSSTLNNIFNFDGTNNERSTGLNPTDKAITLITHPDNSENLVLMTREGSDVPVRTLFIDHDLLMNVVISDTPGSGDPHIVNEIIQDFLPICDSIFYFISATNPIDQADLPLLIQKAEKLPFIPIRYVITRSDEFRLNRNLALDKGNIDVGAVNQFKGQLIARVNEIFPDSSLKSDDLILIDNKDKYNIDNLRQIVVSSIDSIDSEELLRIHSYKIEYYRKNLNEIYSYFLGLIQSKVTKSKGYETTALENIKRFDKNAQINNERLRSLWSSSLNSVNKAHQNEEFIVSEMSTIKSFQPHATSRELTEPNSLINQKIIDVSNGYHGKIVLDINEKIRGLIRSTKTDFKQRIEKGNLLRSDISDIFPTSLDLEIPAINTEVDLSKLNTTLMSYDERLKSIGDNMRHDLIRKIDVLESLIKNITILKTYQNEYSIGQSSVEENFDQYFDLIQMYKGTVLTRNNKETIEKLRIGTQLDELDQEFDETFMESMKSKVLDSIYISLDEDSIEISNAAIQYLADVSNMRLAAKKIKLDVSNPPIELKREEVELEESIVDYIDRKTSKANSHLQSELSDFYNSHSTAYDDHLKKKAKYLGRRKKTIVKWTILSGLIAVILFLVYYFGVGIPAASYGDAILASVIANVIGNLIGYFYSRYKNDPNKVEKQTNNEFIDKQKNLFHSRFSDVFWENYRDLFDENVTLSSSSEIRMRFQNVAEKWQQENRQKLREFKEKLDGLLSEVVKLSNSYFHKINSFHEHKSLVFKNLEKNSEIVKNVTQEIKDASIKPSFEILSETTKSLIDVREKIQMISK